MNLRNKGVRLKNWPSSNWNVFIRILIIAHKNDQTWKKKKTLKCYYRLCKLVRGKRFLQCIQKCKHLPWDFPQMGQSTRTYLERKYVYWLTSIVCITSANLLYWKLKFLHTQHFLCKKINGSQPRQLEHQLLRVEAESPKQISVSKMSFHSLC